MRISLSSVMLALVLSCLNTAVFAQDGTVDPEAGDVSVAESGGAQPEEAASVAPSAGGLKKPISVGLLLGYGISLEDGGNPWGFGFGLRGGYNIDAIYLGARFIYYLGEDPVNIWELGIDGGYDIAVSDKFVVRPGLGLGIANVTVDVPEVLGFGGGSASESEFYIAPAVAGLFDVTDSVFVGLEARFQLILSDPTAKAITLFANGGMRF